MAGAADTQSMKSFHNITIRRADADGSENLSLLRLAALDSAAGLRGEVLVAENGCGAVAALELKSGKAIADPFTHSDHVVDMLRLAA